MANNKLQLVSDLMGVLRGVYIVHATAATLPHQKRITQQRNLTQSQREELNTDQQIQNLNFDETLPVQRDVNQVVAPIAEDHSVAQVEPMDKKKVLTVEKEVKQVQQPILKSEPVKLEQQIPKEIEKEQNLNNEVEEETPFFMKQDRPKFLAQERYVPSSQTSRAFQFGMLGASLIGGTVKEAVKQKIGWSKESPEQQGQSGIKKYAVNSDNADKLQKTFRKMRGAVLKLGQILSTQEASIVPPVIKEAMEKARSEADIMPIKQVVQILEKEYEQKWQKRFKEINLYPFAAASIGQVHEAILQDGMKVALKMQYSGIGESIDSDLNNFKRLITLFGFPRGLYLNELIDSTRIELHWETDYLREAQVQKNYATRLVDYKDDYYCPKVIEDMTTKHILCTEFVEGVEIDTILNQSQAIRDRAGTLLLKLCFKELFEWKIMQTDPNPANYIYDLDRQRLNLIDFGSGRDFNDQFLDGYMNIIYGAYTYNKEHVMHHSLKLKFLTGEENKEMLNAHFLGSLAVAAPFRYTEGRLFDFGNHQVTKQIYEVMPTMSKHRLTPPPKEIYALHRKIIGTYLMCSKLRAKIPAREIYEETYENWIKTAKI